MGREKDIRAIGYGTDGSADRIDLADGSFFEGVEFVGGIGRVDGIEGRNVQDGQIARGQAGRSGRALNGLDDRNAPLEEEFAIDLRLSCAEVAGKEQYQKGDLFTGRFQCECESDQTRRQSVPVKGL